MNIKIITKLLYLIYVHILCKFNFFTKILFIIFVLGSGFLFSSSRTSWIGPYDIEIEFIVVDSVSERPVGNARVALFNALDPEATRRERASDHLGRVRLQGRFTQYGGVVDGRRVTTLRSYGAGAVSVSAEGYEKYCAFLGNANFNYNNIECHKNLDQDLPPKDPIILKIVHAADDADGR